MSLSAKVISFTVLILVLAGSIAGIMYFKGMSEVGSRKLEVGRAQADNRTEPSDNPIPSHATSTEIWSSVAVDQQLGNPFVFQLRTPFRAAAWHVEDAKGNIVASGFSSASDTVEVTGWYDAVPKSKTGWFAVADALSSAMPPYRIPVKLKTQAETVEIYLLNTDKAQAKDCDQAFPVKRDIVSTDGLTLNHYFAALLQLVKGPTAEERAKGYATALPDEVKIIRAGQDETGRYVGDFDAKLTAGITDTCRLTSIRTQIQETLKTVPLPGRTLKGRVYVQGQEADL